MTQGQRQGILIGAVLAITLLALAVPAMAATVTIDASGSSSTDISNLNTAITRAGTNGIVILNPGIYYLYGISPGNSVTIQANTSNGGTAANTIINARSNDRIFTVSGGHSFAIRNLSLRNGRAPNGTAGSDGSESVDGGSGGSGGSGGAILSDGPVTITSSQILNCLAGDGGKGGNGGTGGPKGGEGGSAGNGGSGGAVNSTGTVTIALSTISECSAGNGGSGGTGAGGVIEGGHGGNGGSGGSGGAVNSAGTVTITSSTISECSAGNGGKGGAGGYGNYGKYTEPSGSSGSAGSGSAVSAGSGSVTFCRLAGNTGTALSGPGTLSNNWWGSNTGTSAPCLLLGISATQNAITTAGTSVISANLTYNSDGTDTSASGTIPDWTPVTFSATGGTVSPAYAATNRGIATTTFTPSGTGTAYITATADDESVTVPVTVNAPAAGTNVTSIVIDPVTPAKVYAGLDGSGIFRSTDSGDSWTGATAQPANLHIRALTLNPVTRSTIYTGTYGGGVYKSTDSGATWSACTNTGLTNLNVLTLVSNNTGGIYAGTDDGIYTSTDCDTWDPVNTGLP